jgi:hypothetical protein
MQSNFFCSCWIGAVSIQQSALESRAIQDKAFGPLDLSS